MQTLLRPFTFVRDLVYQLSSLMGPALVVVCALLVVSDTSGGQFDLGNTLFDVVSVVGVVTLGAMVAQAYCDDDDGALALLAVSVFAVWFTVRGLFTGSQQVAMEATWIVAGACCARLVAFGGIRIPLVDPLVDLLARPQH
jgi:hypothetical protein